MCSDRATHDRSLLLLAAGVYGFYAFADQPLWVRLSGLLVVIGVAVFVALQTVVGRAIWSFATESRSEVRKVVWPTRQETVQTTMIVVVFVLLVALILWGLDSFLGWLVSLALK